MRKNKKLMLGAIAAMGVLAMGVGGVGTFAWYTASANATVKTSSQSFGSLGTQKSSISVSDIVIDIILHPAETADVVNKVELSYVHDSKVWINTANAGGVGSEADWTTGVGADAAAKEAWKNAHPVMNTFTATAQLNATANATLNADQKSAVAGKSFKYYVSTAGMVELVDENGIKLTEADDAHKSTVTVSFDASGNINPTAAVTNARYAIRTNNPTGLEYMEENDTNVGLGQPVKVEASAGTALVCYTASTYQIRTRADSSSAFADLTGKFLHDADALVIVADQSDTH